MQDSTGYANPLYAESLAGFGTPRPLSRSGGWLLERDIPETPHRDAMGPYPLFVCQDWTGLQEDLREIDDLVSLALVTDTFGDYDEALLHQCFGTVVRFKEHFVADLTLPPDDIVSKHHRYIRAQGAGERARGRVRRADTLSR